jgi:hypothetical protein
MSNEIAKQNEDGFAGYVDEFENQEQTPNLIRGVCLRFSNDAEWIANGEIIGPDVELLVEDLSRVVQKWGKDKGPPLETIVLGPGQKFPDVEDMNERIPRTEWIQGMAGLKGPWQAGFILHLLDMRTMTKYDWPTATVGGAICIRQLRDRIVSMRKFRPERSPSWP